MSHAKIILGCKLTDIAREEVRSTTVTRYDPETGAPYQKTLTEKAVILGQDAGLRTFKDWQALADWLENPSAGHGMSTALSSSDYCSSRSMAERTVVGFELTVVTSDDDLPVEVPPVPPHAGRATAWLAELGVPPSALKTYLILYA